MEIELQEKQHKRIVVLSVSVLVFAFYAIYKLSSDLAGGGNGGVFSFASYQMYRLSACTLIIAAVVLIAMRSIQDSRLAKYKHFHDSLTDLANRTKLVCLLDANFAKEEAKGGLLLAVDIARVNSINNSLGREAGDEMIAKFSKRLEILFDEPSVVARIGGGTFAIWIPQLSSETAAQLLANELRKTTRISIEIGGRRLFPSMDMGGCWLEKDGNNGAGVLESAEQALSQAKLSKDNDLLIYDTLISEALHLSGSLETDFREAIESGGLEPFYQPLVKEDGKTIIGFEALARWHHPVKGFIPPNIFVPIAEELFLTEQLGRLMMSKAFAFIVPFSDLTMCVNVSPKHFLSASFYADVQVALEESGALPEQIEIEITESVFLEKTDLAIETMMRLRELGVTIALDDFGTGYSGLSYLNQFSVDRIKVDASFVREIGSSVASRSMISTIISMAKERNFSVTVEGVETEEQFDFLKSFKGLWYQGYLFARPSLASEIRHTPLMERYELKRFEADDTLTGDAFSHSNSVPKQHSL